MLETNRDFTIEPHLHAVERRIFLAYERGEHAFVLHTHRSGQKQSTILSHDDAYGEHSFIRITTTPNSQVIEQFTTIEKWGS